METIINFETTVGYSDGEFTVTVHGYSGQRGCLGYSLPVELHRQTFPRYSGYAKHDMAAMATETFLKKLAKLISED